jgi:hypothetical protein
MITNEGKINVSKKNHDFFVTKQINIAWEKINPETMHDYKKGTKKL